HNALPILIFLIAHDHGGATLRTRRLIFRNSGYGQHDAAVDGINFHHLHIQAHAFPGNVCRVVRDLAGNRKLADRHEALDVVAHVDNHTLVHQANDAGAFGLDTNRIGLTDTEPWILLCLLEAEADALVLRIDVEDDHVYRIALLHHFRRVLNALGPGHVGDVDEPVDTRLGLHEGAEAREIALLAADAGSHGVLERKHHPRILLRLLHTKRHFLLLRIDLQHHCLDRLTD